MRTTLDLDPDVLATIRALAGVRKASMGRVASDLIRSSLEKPRSAGRSRNGIPLLRRSAGEGHALVTPETVAALRDEVEP